MNSRIFSQTNLYKFKISLAKKNWEETFFLCCDVDAAYDSFWSEYSRVFEMCFPIIEKQCYVCRAPYIQKYKNSAVANLPSTS